MTRFLHLLPRPVQQWMHNNPMGRRLAHGAFWTLLGTIASRVLAIPVSVVLARWMGPSHYGELGVINNSVDLFIVFAGFGLGLTATKHVAELRTTDPERAGRVLALSTVTAGFTATITAVVLYIAAPYLAAHTLNAPQLTGPLRIGSLILLLAAINGAQQGALYGFEAFRTTAKIQAIVGLLNLPFSLIGYWLGGLNGVLWGMVATRGADWLLRRLALLDESRKSGVPLGLKGWTQELHVLWKYSVPALLSGVMVAPVNWVCAAMLVNQPKGYAQMGIYNAANQWYGALLFLPTVLGSGLLPLLSERMGNKDSHSSGKVLLFMLRLNAVIVLPAAFLGSALSPWIMRLYGPAYAHGWSTLVAVLFTAAVFAVLIPVGDVIAASGRMWTGTVMNAGWAAVFIAGTAVLVHRGAFGLGLARLIAYIAHAIWTIAFAWILITRAKASQQAISSAAITAGSEAA
ncbi:MAG TPA: oligosaccharide flippase family protein [Pseudacidobacterium sp.]|nr:oligosaccharide flippase family protein [Pseudacidobacterium sp.]